MLCGRGWCKDAALSGSRQASRVVGHGRRCEGQLPSWSQLPSASSPQFDAPQRHHTRQHEAIRGLCRLIAVLRSACSSPHRQPRDCASHHRPAPGPIAIPRGRACRRRDDSTHQHVWRPAAEAIRRRGCPCIQGASPSMGRGRRAGRGNRWAGAVRASSHCRRHRLTRAASHHQRRVRSHTGLCHFRRTLAV